MLHGLLQPLPALGCRGGLVFNLNSIFSLVATANQQLRAVLLHQEGMSPEPLLEAHVVFGREILITPLRFILYYEYTVSAA